MKKIQNQLFSLQDKTYKEFHQKLMPTVPKDEVIGIRIPVLRKFAKDFSKTDDAKAFIKNLPHKYYEENNLHAFVVETIKDYETAVCETERFLPYIDNWATCDMFLPPVFKKYKDKLIKKIYIWIKSKDTYTVRYAIGLLLKLYLDADFKNEYPKIVSEVKSDEYYVNMMIAWYFATALAKQYDEVIPYITGKKLDTWVHNKTIQKAVESNRISRDLKIYLKSLKRGE